MWKRVQNANISYILYFDTDEAIQYSLQRFVNKLVHLPPARAMDWFLLPVPKWLVMLRTQATMTADVCFELV